MSAGIARIKRSALAALPATSGTDFRPQVREPVHRVILEARAVRQEKFPDLLEVLDREHALALPSAPKEDLSVHEFLEMVRQHAGRHSEHLSDSPEMDAGVRRQEVLDPAPALEFEAFGHLITAAERGRGPQALRGSARAIRCRRRRRPGWRSR